jgi:uncharacterized membrane-anchored protein
VVGTQITDFLTDKLEISLYVSTAAFSVLLALTFVVWYAFERTLDPYDRHDAAGALLLGCHSIHFRPRHSRG